MKLSVIIITKNEERNISRCLESVRWADEIIVVDDHSDDKTREICAQAGALVITREWDGFSRQKEFALLQASHPWVLSLDADEVVTTELHEEIQKILASPGEVSGYRIPRKSYFLGRWMRYGGWYPGYQLRLFKKENVYMNHRPVHEGFEVDGKVGTLASDIDHYTYHSLHHYLEKMNEYTSLEVMNKISGGRKISWYHFILNPISVFLRMFFSLKGWKDGFLGFLLACFSSLYTLLVFAKCWEYQNHTHFGIETPPVNQSEITHYKLMH